MNYEEQILALLLAMQSDITGLKAGQGKLQNHLIALENELVPKVTVPFDAFELRGDQIENLKNHIDERLDDFGKKTPPISFPKSPSKKNKSFSFQNKLSK